MIRVMLLESDINYAENICEVLRNGNCDLYQYRNSADFLSSIDEIKPDVLIFDVVLEGNASKGFEVLQYLMTDNAYDYRIIAYSKEEALPWIHEVYRIGDYYIYDKGSYFNLNQLAVLVTNAYLKKNLEKVNLSQKINRFQLEKSLVYSHPFIGDSESINAVRNQIIRLAKADEDMFIIGETGTGKEVAAYYYYMNSTRFGKSFEVVNCSALTETLIESELFGHIKGSFTDADRTKTGLFEKSHKGILFLDEITNLSLASQSKLLRAIENKEIQIVGGESKKVDTKLIFASNATLDRLVQPEVIRKDLFYRIESNIVELPPLRERGNDIMLLMNYFLAGYARPNSKIDFSSLTVLKDLVLSYYWPGNVRELKNFCKYMMISEIEVTSKVLKRQLEVKIDKFNQTVLQDHQPYYMAGNLKAGTAMFESDYLKYHLNKHNWQVNKTANHIGLERTTLYKKMKLYKLRSSTKHEAV
jgi:two-component system, NtrC family, nitrogen regulation response regulator NtrX